MIFGWSSLRNAFLGTAVWLYILAGAAPIKAQMPSPLPELIYYNFDGTGSTVKNLAGAATRVNASGTLVGSVTQGGSTIYPSGMVGSGGSARTDHMNTGWTTSLSGSWTISVCLNHIPSTGSQAYYLFGDKTARQFRCIANGTSGPNTVTLRATNIVDVVVAGALVPGEATVTHFVYDAGAGVIHAYVNGVLKTTVDQPFSPITLTGTSTLKVGGYSSDPVDQSLVGLPLNGILDEFRLYNRALSLAEIQSSWQFGVVPTKPDYEITTAGGQINIVDLSGNGETLTASAPAPGQLLFAAAGRKFRVDGGALRDGDSGHLDLSSVTQITISTEKGDDQINIGAFASLPSLNVNGGEGSDTVTFTGNISFNSDASLTVDQLTDTDRCVISGQLQLSGAGAATVRTSRDLVLNPGAGISVVDGDLTLEAHQQLVPLPENFPALKLHGSLMSTGVGNINLAGRGAAAAAPAPGVLLEDATVTSSGTGSVTVTGSMAGNSDVASVAVVLRRSSVSSTGNITLTGTGGAAPAIPASVLGSAGILIESSSSVSAQGTAEVKLEGTSGQTTGQSQGLVLLGNISTAGQLAIIGGTSLNTTAGSTSNHGVVLNNTVNLGAGELRLTGTAGLDSTDVEIGGGASLTATTQKILGSKINLGTATLTANTALHLTADQLIIDPANATLRGTTTEILTKTVARPIELGSADSATILGLTDAELDRLTSTTLKIGNADSGGITQLAAISRTGALELRSGGNISLQSGQITASGLLIDATSTITTKVTGTDADLSSGGPGTLQFGSAELLDLTITSADVCDTVKVLGHVRLTGATLQLSGSYAPALYGECFLIVDNDGTDPIDGTFTGLPEGAVIPFNGRDLKITYLGGDGNDVILATEPDYTITSTVGGGPLVVANPSGTDDSLGFSQLPGGAISLTAAGRKFSVDGGPIRDGNSGSVPISTGVTRVVINAGDGDDVITLGAATDMPPMTINGGKGDDTVSFTGAMGFKADADLDVDLRNDDPLPGVDRCNIGGQLTLTGTGKAIFNVTRSLLMTTGGGISAVNGNIVLSAHLDGAPLVDNFTAIELHGGLSSTGAGEIWVSGRGAAGAAETAGVCLQDASINATGAGPVTINGQMVGTSATRSIGLRLVNSSVVAAGELKVSGKAGDGTSAPADMASVGILLEQLSLVEATGGKPMTIEGSSSALPRSGSSLGTVIKGSTVRNTGSHMTLTGNGETTADGTSRGLIIIESSKVFCLGNTLSTLTGVTGVQSQGPAGSTGSLGCQISADSRVEGNTIGGSITINGTSSPSNTSSRGLLVEGSITGGGTAVSLSGDSTNSAVGSSQNHGLVLTGTVNTGTVALGLTGGTRTSSPTSNGIHIAQTASITGGAVALSGTAANQPGSEAVYLASASVTSSTLTIDADSLSIAPAAMATGTAGAIKPTSNALAIGLGATDRNGLLGLSGAELARLNFGTLTIGSATTGEIQQTAAISVTGKLELHSGASITLGTLTATGDILLNAVNFVTPASTGCTVTTPKLSFAANNKLQIVIANDGTYQGLAVNGQVDVANVGLSLVGSYVPPPGYTILPVVNDGADAIIGQFTGVPEDGEYPFNGADFVITYLGGTGNDLEMFTYGDPVVTPGPITLNQDTGLYEQVLTLTNPQPKAMRGVRLTVLNIEQKIVLQNRSHPFLPIIESDVIVPARGSATLTVRYYNGGRNLGTWVPQYLVESLNRDLGPMPGDFSGLYHGLASRTASVNPNTGSSLTLTLSKTGACTGSLTTEGKTVKFTGLISIDPLNPLKPRFSQTFSTIQRQLDVSFDPVLQTITGELSSQAVGASAGAPVVGWRQPWTLKAPLNPAPGFKGRHNMSLTHVDPAVTVPQGVAFASLTVAKDDGVFAMAGRLPDGSAITGSSFIGAEGQVRIFTPLYKSTGSVLGQLKVTLLRPTIPSPSIIPNPVSGTLDWFRPAASIKSKDRFYRPGVALNLTAEGGLYSPPAAGQLLNALPASIPGAPNTVMEFEDGGLGIHDGLAQLLRLYNPAATGLTNKVQITTRTPYAVSVLVFDSTKGLFSGKFTVPGAVGVPSRSGSYSGMLVPKVGYLLGTGYFLLPQLPARLQTTANSPMLSGKVHFWDNRVPATP